MRAFWDICGAFLGNNKKTLNIVVLQYFGKYIYLIEHCGISILGPRVRQGFMRRGEACFRHLNLNSILNNNAQLNNTAIMIMCNRMYKCDLVSWIWEVWVKPDVWALICIFCLILIWSMVIRLIIWWSYHDPVWVSIIWVSLFVEVWIGSSARTKSQTLYWSKSLSETLYWSESSQGYKLLRSSTDV